MTRYFQRRRLQAEMAIIGALSDGPLSGYPLSKASGLRPGRLYPALARLEGTGRIESRWADGPYPRRRIYHLPGGDLRG